MEAHGGYTFCGLATLVILKKERSLNLKSLLVSVCWFLFLSGPLAPGDVTTQTGFRKVWLWEGLTIPALSSQTESPVMKL